MLALIDELLSGPNGDLIFKIALGALVLVLVVLVALPSRGGVITKDELERRQSDRAPR